MAIRHDQAYNMTLLRTITRRKQYWSHPQIPTMCRTGMKRNSAAEEATWTICHHWSVKYDIIPYQTFAFVTGPNNIAITKQAIPQTPQPLSPTPSSASIYKVPALCFTPALKQFTTQCPTVPQQLPPTFINTGPANLSLIPNHQPHLWR